MSNLNRNAYSHNVINVNIQKINVLKLKISILIFLIIVLSCAYLKTYHLQFYNCAIKVMTPTQELYSESGNAIFASLNKELKIVLPIKCESYEVIDNSIVMNSVDNVMVLSPETGVVSQVGKLNHGGKYIKIDFINGISCTIENLVVVGVKNGDIVKKGIEIATIDPNSKVIMKIFSSGGNVNNLQVIKNIVQWTD
ncbi:MAG: peptidoglycan DD-metalloendopeptidase family protein [Clostridia bacterium]|nr:peptidoglycan DD-metalloendopeptidase family protein [Clostridia bacterium]